MSRRARPGPRARCSGMADGADRHHAGPARQSCDAHRHQQPRRHRRQVHCDRRCCGASGERSRRRTAARLHRANDRRPSTTPASIVGNHRSAGPAVRRVPVRWSTACTTRCRCRQARLGACAEGINARGTIVGYVVTPDRPTSRSSGRATRSIPLSGDVGHVLRQRLGHQQPRRRRRPRPRPRRRTTTAGHRVARRRRSAGSKADGSVAGHQQSRRRRRPHLHPRASADPRRDLAEGADARAVRPTRREWSMGLDSPRRRASPLVLVSVVAAAPAAAQTTVVDITPDSIFASALSEINNRGQAVGKAALGSSDNERAIVWQDGTLMRPRRSPRLPVEWRGRDQRTGSDRRRRHGRVPIAGRPLGERRDHRPDAAGVGLVPGERHQQPGRYRRHLRPSCRLQHGRVVARRRAHRTGRAARIQRERRRRDQRRRRRDRLAPHDVRGSLDGVPLGRRHHDRPARAARNDEHACVRHQRRRHHRRHGDRTIRRQPAARRVARDRRRAAERNVGQRHRRGPRDQQPRRRRRGHLRRHRRLRVVRRSLQAARVAIRLVPAGDQRPRCRRRLHPDGGRQPRARRRLGKGADADSARQSPPGHRRAAARLPRHAGRREQLRHPHQRPPADHRLQRIRSGSPGDASVPVGERRHARSQRRPRRARFRSGHQRPGTRRGRRGRPRGWQHIWCGVAQRDHGPLAPAARLERIVRPRPSTRSDWWPASASSTWIRCSRSSSACSGGTA